MEGSGRVCNNVSWEGNLVRRGVGGREEEGRGRDELRKQEGGEMREEDIKGGEVREEEGEMRGGRS